MDCWGPCGVRLPVNLIKPGPLRLIYGDGMQHAWHFVGFKNDRVYNALSVFGYPDFWHRLWDERAVREVADGDIVLFANGDETQPVREFTHDDSQLF